VNVIDDRLGRAAALQRRVRLLGPISVAEYMTSAMIGMGDGYYASGQPIGAEGDFITAPEISQMFGELLGLWCVDVWSRMGRPDPVLLVELGPGRGAMMTDMMRAAGVNSPFAAAVEIHLVEISDPLRALQQSALHSLEPTWHRDVSSLPAGPAIVIGNEFLDVLPIHQFVMTENGWLERAVAIEGDRLCWSAIAPGASLGFLSANHRAAKLGDIAEISPAAIGFVAHLARQLVEQGGAALFIDYGRAESELGATLQAVRRHRAVDPLEHFGMADLTAHVDFSALRQAAMDVGARVAGPIEQGRFLTNMGIAVRAERLSRDATPEQRADIEASLNRLIGSDHMGSLFKAMAVYAPGLDCLAGFA
jgi:NADH dehydrogenase [ubiquinone] 1 alpha subcomplex assembly factor 7